MNRLSNDQCESYISKTSLHRVDVFLGDSTTPICARLAKERVVTRHCSCIVTEACAGILPSVVSIVERVRAKLVGGREEKSSSAFVRRKGAPCEDVSPLLRLIRLFSVRQPTSISIDVRDYVHSCDRTHSAEARVNHFRR